MTKVVVFREVGKWRVAHGDDFGYKSDDDKCDPFQRGVN